MSSSELNLIIEGLSQSNDSNISLEGSITVYQYESQPYMYILKSDIFKTVESSVKNFGSTQIKPISNRSHKTFSLTQNLAQGRNKNIKPDKLKVSSFEFVELINSIVLDRR